MTINTLAYAQLFQQELDKQVVAGATTGWMEGNAGLVQYNGGNTVKIPKLVMDGLGDYDRSNGFTQGSATLTYETKTMTQDRGRTFMLDSMDVNETNFVANASNLMGEFQRTQVIPEIDAYRYSTIAKAAIAGSQASGGYTPAVADIYTKLKADITNIQDVIGAVPLVVTMSTATIGVLESSTELSRQLTLGAFNGNVNTQVKQVDDCPIIEVPSARFKTAYAFFDGKTTGQTVGGFAPVAKASVTISGVKYEAASVGLAGNAYTVTIVQGTGASVATAGVITAAGALTITLGTNSGSTPLSVTATQIAALTFTGDGAALITTTAVTGATVQSAATVKSLAGGAGSGAIAKSINWIICAASTPIAISKTDNMRIFAPDVNQTADAWKLDYRKYHDLWIMDNKLSTVFVNVKEALV